MKLWKKVVLGLLGTLSAMLVALVVTFFVLDRRRYDAPMPAITASRDPTVIARGRSLAYGVAHCIDCHGAPGAENSATIALSGGHEWALPLGKIYAKNITPDRETGIGKLTDGEIARTLRYGVGHDGRAILPFMSFANLSDEDLTAIVSFLRAEAPVHHLVPAHRPNLLGRLALAFLIRPHGPGGAPPASSPVGPTIERGKYLANDVGNCVSCHTKLDDVGRPIGPSFAGGGRHVSSDASGRIFVSPNLTPDAATGRITQWSEDTFVLRFRTGAGPSGSPMPWRAFGNIPEDDVRALYRYLRSLPPVRNLVEVPREQVVATQ